MGAIDGIPLLLTVAEETARKTDEQFSKLSRLTDQQQQRATFVNNLRIATVEIEVAVVGVFSLFEARMQHHFPKGSFYRQLRKRLIDGGQPDLADRVYHYFLAVNVLKHGQGASYEELREIPNLPFAVKQPEDVFFDEGDVAEPEGLVDIQAAGFFVGLVETLRQAYHFLES